MSSVCFIFRGDIRYDTRLDNLVRAYTDRGWAVRVIQGGSEDRVFTHAGARVTSFRSTEQGAWGFLKYWIRAAQLAGRERSDVYWACELYSLPVAVWRARLSGGRIGYDSRELFAHLGALKGSPLKQRYWHGMERGLIPLADGVITSGDMDSDYLEERYGVERPQVVRNVPRFEMVPRGNRLRTELGIPDTMPVCLYQGGLQEGRGLKIMIEIAELFTDAAFVFIGDGELAGMIDEAAGHLPNVYRIAKVPHTEMISYASSATLGFALIEPITLSYLLALPNKMFEYIMAGTPVVASYAPQMEKIIDEFHVGAAVPFDCMGDILSAVRNLLDNREDYAKCAANCAEAARVLNWEREEQGFAEFARSKGLL